MSSIPLIAPGVQINQYNLTNTITQANSTNCGMVLRANTGPCLTPIAITNETDLVNAFGKPDNTNYMDWFNAWNFLQYSSSLYAVRPMNVATTNAGITITGGNIVGTTPTPAVTEGMSLANMYNINVAEQSISATAINAGLAFFNKNVTSVQNLAVAICSSASGWNLPITADTTQVFDPTIQSSVESIATFGSFFKYQPIWSQGQYAILVFQKNPIYNNLYSKVESWIVSNNPLAQNSSGSNIYVNNVFLYQSQYLYAILGSGTQTPVNTQGNPLVEINIVSDSDVYPSAGTLATSNLTYTGIYEQADIQNAEEVFVNEDVSYYCPLFIAHQLDINGFSTISTQSGKNFTVVAPYDVTEIIGQNASAITAYLNSNYGTLSNNPNMEYNQFSTYSGVFGNLKYQYDKFNNVNRWVNLGGDIAGLLSQTDASLGPWWSATGYIRGQVLNCIKLAFSPNQTLRNSLYQNGINSVILVPGEGSAIVWGQTTSTATASAFDMIPTQRMFIYIEQSIEKAMMSFVDNFTNPFTWNQVTNMINPFLQTIQSLQGIYAFQVVCNATNNTAAVMQQEAMVVDMYIQPTAYAEKIYVNAYAVPTGVSFTTIIPSSGSLGAS